MNLQNQQKNFVQDRGAIASNPDVKVYNPETQEYGAITSSDTEYNGDHLVNTGNTDLIFIEVQLGEYFGEDDIVRLEDIYGRV